MRKIKYISYTNKRTDERGRVKAEYADLPVKTPPPFGVREIAIPGSTVVIQIVPWVFLTLEYDKKSGTSSLKWAECTGSALYYVSKDGVAYTGYLNVYDDLKTFKDVQRFSGGKFGEVTEDTLYNRACEIRAMYKAERVTPEELCRRHAELLKDEPINEKESKNMAEEKKTRKRKTKDVSEDTNLDTMPQDTATEEVRVDLFTSLDCVVDDLKGAFAELEDKFNTARLDATVCNAAAGDAQAQAEALREESRALQAEIKGLEKEKKALAGAAEKAVKDYRKAVADRLKDYAAEVKADENLAKDKAWRKYVLELVKDITNEVKNVE